MLLLVDGAEKRPELQRIESEPGARIFLHHSLVCQNERDWLLTLLHHRIAFSATLDSAAPHIGWALVNGFSRRRHAYQPPLDLNYAGRIPGDDDVPTIWIHWETRGY